MGTGNDLMVLTPEQERAEIERLLGVQAPKDSFVFVPVQLTVAPGGSAAFVTGDGEMVAAPLTGVVIGSIVARGLWRKGNKVPFCSSMGGDVGHVNPTHTSEDVEAVRHEFDAQHPYISEFDAGSAAVDGYSCRHCTMNAFGSSGLGKACKEKRRLLFLPDGWSAPAILNLPTMSVKGWDTYCSTLATKSRRQFYAVRTTFGIARAENAQKQPYGIAVASLAGPITDLPLARFVAELMKQFGELLRETEMVDEYASGTAGSTENGGAYDETPF
jgi:hypothetical protein